MYFIKPKIHNVKKKITLRKTFLSYSNSVSFQTGRKETNVHQ